MHLVSVRGGQLAITREERGVEPLRESNVHGIVCADAVTQIPDAPDERKMRVCFKSKIRKIPESLFCCVYCGFSKDYHPLERTRNLREDEFRSMQRI